MSFSKGRLFINNLEIPNTKAEKLTPYLLGDSGNYIQATETLGAHTFYVWYNPEEFYFDFSPRQLGESNYYVAGDYRDSSRDSRHIGPVTADRILGRVTKIVESEYPDRVGIAPE